jgi:hypothetical protein
MKRITVTVTTAADADLDEQDNAYPPKVVNLAKSLDSIRSTINDELDKLEKQLNANKKQLANIYPFESEDPHALSAYNLISRALNSAVSEIGEIEEALSILQNGERKS